MFYSAAKYSVFRTQHPSISLPLCLSVSLSLSVSVCVCVSLCLSFSLSLSLYFLFWVYLPISLLFLLSLYSFSSPICLHLSPTPPLRYLISVSVTSPLWAYVSCIIHIAITVHTHVCYCFASFVFLVGFIPFSVACVFWGGIWGFLCWFFLPSFYGYLSHSMFIVLLLLCFLLVSFFFFCCL